MDEVVVISRGRLVAQGPLEELTRGAGAPVRVRSPDAERLAGALAGPGIVLDRDGAAACSCAALRPMVGTAAAEHGIVLHELMAQAHSLEDVFLELTSAPEPPATPAGRAIASELLKLRTTRSFWGFLLAALGLVGLIVVLTLALQRHVEGESDVRSLLSTAGFAGLLAIVLGVVNNAGEYRHGTIGATLLVTPDHLRATVAKVVACAAGGLAIGIATAALTAAVSLPWLSSKGDAIGLSAHEVAGLFLGGIFYAALAGALGVGLGALLRNQVVAVVLVLIFIVDPAVAALSPGYAKFSLQGLGAALSGAAEEHGDDSAHLFPFGVAALVWGGYTCALVAAAALVTSRRNVITCGSGSPPDPFVSEVLEEVEVGHAQRLGEVGHAQRLGTPRTRSACAR